MLYVNLAFVFTDKYWSDALNRRKFFIEFASQKGFDPLVASNWENVQYQEILKEIKKKNSQKQRFVVHSALLQSFPEIGLDPIKLYVSWFQIHPSMHTQ